MLFSVIRWVAVQFVADNPGLWQVERPHTDISISVPVSVRERERERVKERE